MQGKPSYQALKMSAATLCLFIFLSDIASAAPPVTFEAKYDARFQGFKAKAEISLQALENDLFELQSKVSLKLFGKSISSINERSSFIWQDDHVLPQQYNYRQKGLGKRSRSIEYDWSNNTALTIVKGEENELILQDKLLDDLTLYTELKRQVANNIQNIYIEVIDKNTIKTHHYEIVGEELLESPLGTLNTVKLKRIREEDSPRSTELWLAKDWNYLLVRLYQNNKGKEFQINLKKASLNGIAVTPINQ